VKLCVLLLIVLMFVLSGCSIWYDFMSVVGDHGYRVCAFIRGVVVDSSTHKPLKDVSVKIYRYKYLEYQDITDSAGMYGHNKVELLFSSTSKEISELRKKPPIRKKIELRMVFEKTGYRKHELLVPVEFVCCSLHPPQEVTISEVKIEDVYLVKE